MVNLAETIFYAKRAAVANLGRILLRGIDLSLPKFSEDN
jgi:hypothetical protein